MILKFLTFLFVLYLLFRLFGFIFRPLLMMMGKRAFMRAQGRQQQQHQQQKRRRNPDGSVHIDHAPPKDKKQQSDFRGGEYVDYEEVK